MKRLAFWIVIVTLAAATSGSAFAADLTPGDYRLLQSDFGLMRDGRFIKDMTPAERAELDRIINDPTFARFPKVRSDNAADYLYHVHLRECRTWQQSGGDQEACPPSGNPTVDSGQKIAERHCNFCHLFGTPNAPSFHKLASTDLNEKKLAAALAAGHEMSPIGLQPAEIADLMAYILSLK